MTGYLLDWLSLLGRWLHVTAGIAWIGASFYFVWLDDHLLPPTAQAQRDAGVGGELWAVHGGGFYHAQKYRLAPPQLPPQLHWFYWEAYTTWLSGFFLLCLLYFGQAEIYLIDPSVAALSKPVAIALGLAFILGGWLIYDGLCRSPLGRNERWLGALLVLLLAGAAWALCRLFSGRGAYIEFGAILGTIMVANVFFVIIPGQRELVAAKREGRMSDPAPGLRGKQRSVHNTYFTLPVLFVMISNHYAMTYGARYNWLALILLCLGGACIRAWFVARHKAHTRQGRTSPLSAMLGVAMIAGAIVLLMPRGQAVTTTARSVEFAQVQAVIQQRCAVCHSARPTQPGFVSAPKGVLLDTAEHIGAQTQQIAQQIRSRTMPIGNLTHMSEAERELVLNWIARGAPR